MELLLIGAVAGWLICVFIIGCYRLFRLLTFDLRQLGDIALNALEETDDTITVTIHVEIGDSSQAQPDATAPRPPQGGR